MEANFDALAAVHDRGLLNGDIQCSNFLVDYRVHQGVRLIDFGFSRPVTSSKDCKRAFAIGSHVGTCAEMKLGELTQKEALLWAVYCEY